MNKYKLIFLLSIFFFSCEDETVDITVMPEATTVGAQTFGCLVDGWLYVGGRYWTMQSPSIDFTYSPEENIFYANVVVAPDISFHFRIPQPKEGECQLENITWNREPMDNCIVNITRFDKEAQIISGEFNGGRITLGRFDVNYIVYP